MATDYHSPDHAAAGSRDTQDQEPAPAEPGHPAAAEREVNHGACIRNASTSPARTIIVTGLARSGTSMVARMLSVAGVFMGSVLDDIVYEDADVAALIEQGDVEPLRRLAQQRSSDHAVWGFKKPHLHRFMPAEAVSALVSPVAIVICRDPVAVAARNSISEHLSVESSLLAAVMDAAAMMAFALTLPCPTLLVSYEKALQNRRQFAGMLIDFCRLPVSPAIRAQMVCAIEPGREAYLIHAQRRFEGYLDSIQDGVLRGWCRQIGSNDAIALDILVDGRHVASTTSDLFRADLASIGFGTGHHGYEVDAGEFLQTGHELIEVLVQGRLFRLTNNSG